jgi:hypothetical protein
MRDLSQNTPITSSFQLDKWYLDYTGSNGEAMIFYSARLYWHGFKLSYTSWLNHNPGYGVQLKYRLSRVQTPFRKAGTLTWTDKDFGISGTWKSRAPEIRVRLFEDNAGYLDWKCYQPLSEVELAIGDSLLLGSGYAEELTLTTLPWKIPMNELRWGRFLAEDSYMVWIELRNQDKKQWLWMNGEKIDECIIEDDQIKVPRRNISLTLDKWITLESEKKIASVLQNTGRYVPGFRKAVPLQFMLADEHKWMSRGMLKIPGKPDSGGMAIHELVNFRC